MNKIKTKNQGRLMLASVCALILASCTKEIPYQALAPEVKEDTQSKSLFDEKAEYLYSASQQNASRSAADAFPFASGDNKRVKLKILKDSLRILEVERDQRFSANATNDKLVLEIPIEHVQYQCAKDRFGECTNTEENATDIPWEQRNSIKIKFENAKSGELDMLPILESRTWGDNCYDEVSSRIVKSDVTKDAINFQVERTFKTNLECLSDDAVSLSDATITSIYHYSLVKLDSVLSKDYKTVSYPEGSSDEQTFGFFSSRKNLLDVDNNNTDRSTIQIMNRWNPNRKEIVYHLSDEFAKKENALLKDLTHQTVNSLNNGLAEAGVNFRINLKDPSGKIPGDIRNSMIVLVEDPVASSVIGYGPQTEDPVTGEIISARTVMFLGTIKKFVKYTYDEIIREKRTAAAEAKAATNKLALSSDLVSKVDTLKKTGKVFGASSLTDAVMKKIADSSAAAAAAKAKEEEELDEKKIVKSSNMTLPTQKLAKIKASLKNYTASKNPEFIGKDLKSQMRYLQEAKNCAFAPVMESAAGGISQKLMSQFPDDAKPWEQLSASEKELALNIILPDIWVPTLIHEIGHNLGLRHNFAASEDKANFLSQEELAKIGVDHAIPFSSVMDYGNDLKTLPVLGKYDIAALKFGYLRQIEVQSGDNTSVVELKDTLDNTKPALEAEGLTIKDYQFCTDEHVGINAGCKRFDLGTNYTEIVQNMIQDYEDAYSTRNLRAGRASMSLMDDLKYGSRINSIFKELRIMMEVVERLKNRFDLADDAPEWESIEFLKDLKQASLLSGSFLANVLLVPDTTCAVALSANPSEVIAILPLTDIDPEAISCFKLQLQPQFKVVAQGGKMFNSKKDPDSTNSYADQIDVRGIWLDKVMAVRQLTNRQIGIHSMDEHSDNFLNMTDLRQGILDAVQGLMTNNVVNKVTFTLEDGSQADLEISYDMGASQVIKKPMLIDSLERQGASATTVEKFANRMGVRTNGTTPIQQTVANQIAASAIDPLNVHLEDKAINASFSVHKLNSVVNQKISKTAKVVTIDNTVFVADTANTLARESIENLAIAGAIEAALEKVSQKKLEEILEAKLAKKPMPPNTSKDEKIVWKMKTEDLKAHVDGVLKSTQFYKDLLQILPTAAVL